MINIIQEAANQYYILEIGLLMLLESSNVVGNADSVRRSPDKTKFILKTRDGLVDIPELSGHTPLSAEQLEAKLNEPEWSGEEI